MELSSAQPCSATGIRACIQKQRTMASLIRWVLFACLKIKLRQFDPPFGHKSRRGFDGEILSIRPLR